QWIVTRALEGFPCTLEKETMLRIHDLCFPGVDSEKRRIEKVRVLQYGCSAYIARVLGQRWIKTAGAKVVIRDKRDGLNTIAKVAPELLNVRRTRETSGHRDDRNTVYRVVAVMTVI